MEEQYVNFETAKLLKEKGFDISLCSHWYNISDEDPFPCPVGNKECLPCPTQQMTMRWLREVHKIDINITCEHQDILNAAGNKIKVYEVDIITPNGSIYIGNWNHYESAIEAAIRYCLENLI